MLARFRRPLAAIAVLGLTFGLAACDEEDLAGDPTPSAPVSTTATSESTAPTKEPTEVETTEQEPTDEAPTEPEPGKPTDLRELIAGNSIITENGIGAYRIGTKASELQKKGLVVPSNTCEKDYEPTTFPKKLTISTTFRTDDGTLLGVSTRNSAMRTREGAHTGLTVKEIRKIYGVQASDTDVVLDGDDTVTMLQVGTGENVYLFAAMNSQGDYIPAQDDQQVDEVIVIRNLHQMFWGGC